jgi:hypothetical protein
MDAVAELRAQLAALNPREEHKVYKSALEQTSSVKWVPNPGPQTQAYLSDADCLLFGGEPGGGKQVSIHSLIPTPNGWTTMAEICVGQQVIDDTGRPCMVVAKSNVDWTEQAYRLTFSDGSVIEAGARHQWVTSTRAERMRALKCNDEWRAARRANRPLRGTGKRPDLAKRNAESAVSQDLPTSSIKTTQQIFETLKRGDGGLNHAIAVAGSLQLPCAELLIDPYALGAWLGDGASKSGQITGLDEEIFQQIANGGYVVTQHACPKSRGVLGIQKHLKQLGVFGNKHIPPAYLRASFDQRLALLQGLMDTDGYCDTRGQCEIQLTRKELIDGVHELLSSLGIKAEMRDGDATLYGRVVSRKWRLKFMTELPAFKLPRKLIRQKRSGFRGTHSVRYIVGCEPIAPIPMQCIQVDSPSHCYLVGKTMIPTHNSQLILGLAFNEHKRSLIMRRQYGELDRLVDDALKIHGSREGFNGSPPPKLRVTDKQIIEFAAAHRVGDEQAQMGKGRDLLGIDEATHFAEQQVRFLMGWNRSEDPNQRVRTVLATNPPLSAEGLWVLKMFAPWIDPQYPNPAKPGELRWVISDDDGNDLWVNGPEDIRTNSSGKKIRPTSRTYIPSKVSDNPYYAASDYERQLDAMPEPYRSLLLGGFTTSFKDQPAQIIPTKWVQLAQERWTKTPPVGIPMCVIGVDASGGGADPMVMAARHDGWYAPLVEIQGKDIPMENIGPYGAGRIISLRRDNALVVIDMSGGYGGSMYDHLRHNGVEVKSYKGAEATPRRSIDGKLKFVNKRTAALWGMREALDPGQPGGSPIMLPPDAKIVADLTAPTFEVVPNGIKAEAKEKICDRLGRSTDAGDAIVMCWFEGGRKATNVVDWMDLKKGKGGYLEKIPQVLTSGRKPLTANRATRH